MKKDYFELEGSLVRGLQILLSLRAVQWLCRCCSVADTIREQLDYGSKSRMDPEKQSECLLQKKHRGVISGQGS